MATHSQHNNTAVAATSEHNKRVSFGGEEHVQMIEYDDGVENDYSIAGYRQHHGPATFTEPDAPLSRVRVHAEQAEVPRPISPPAQITPVLMDAVNSPASGSNATHPTTTLVNSPPLPSFVKKAEHDNENPFRPDEQLYHEVDPIVEMYRQRPFPPSPSHGSPVPPHQQHQNTQQPSQQSSRVEQKTYANGGGSGRNSSLAEVRLDNNTSRQNASDQLLIDTSAPAPTDGLGPPGRAELVRIPEKKKRSCCSLQ